MLDFLMNLTLALYRVTKKISFQEPLRFALRKKANQILSDSILIFSKNPLSLTKEQRYKHSMRALKNIKIVQTFFKLAEAQDWMDRQNFLILNQEYDKLKIQIQNLQSPGLCKTYRDPDSVNFAQGEKAINQQKPIINQQKPIDNISNIENNGRHKRILEFLKQKSQAQIKDLKEIFPEVSKRTLRRDFDQLLKTGLVKRTGNNNRTIYELVRT